MNRIKLPPVYSDPHPGTDHPGEWLETTTPNRWIRYLKPGETLTEPTGDTDGKPEERREV